MHFVSVIILCNIIGCAVEKGTVRVKDGTPYGVVPGTWRARWWNYYQRGLSYAEGEFWHEASADFQAAVKQRRGQTDRRRAYTYGVHYLDYFPHRELGIAYYHLGQYDEAIRELETSLSTVDTAKAKFYLNKVRKVLLKKTGRDATPPRIFLDAPSDRRITNSTTIIVKGYVADDTYASAISINDQVLFSIH